MHCVCKAHRFSAELDAPLAAPAPGEPCGCARPPRVRQYREVSLRHGEDDEVPEVTIACRRRLALPRRAALLTAGAVTLAAGALATVAKLGRGRMASGNHQEVVEQALMRGQACGPVEADVDYILEGDFLLLVAQVEDGDRCCKVCDWQDQCHAWTWVLNASLVPGAGQGECWLKGGRLVQKMRKAGLLAGLKASIGRPAAGGPPTLGQTATRAEAKDTANGHQLPTTSSTTTTTTTRAAGEIGAAHPGLPAPDG
mmetsp:Transcript_3335/g.8377  ORF Transcript_3335/g.8377 Transcript_3335/m.8377 type:complete len:255 (-) Transcript_3335:19-783(-)